MINSKSSYGIIGNGNVSRHLQNYFRYIKLPFTVWSRKSSKSPEKQLKNCKVIFILIKDSEIENFIKSHPLLKNKTLIHFSGSLTTKLAFGFHPLMTFSKKFFSLQEYKNICFVSDEGTPKLKDIVPELKNPEIKIPVKLKPYYHAMCVMGSNFSVILWNKVLRELVQKFKIPQKYILNYFKKTFENFKNCPEKSLTGPFARNDRETIKKNLLALKNDKFKQVYLAFKNSYFEN